MTKYHFKKENMPYYGQLINSCGLAATLMLVNPNQDSYVQSLLTQIGKKLKVIYPALGDLLESKP